MTCLGVDTALGACSVALADEGGVRRRLFETMSVGQAEALAPMTQRLLAEAGLAPGALTRISVTTGPGTFTGQRIGLAFARGLTLALKIPCVGVTTLEAIAASARAERPGARVFVAIDARRGEVYGQAFGGETPDAPALLTLDDAAARAAALGDGTMLAGTAAAALAERAAQTRFVIASQAQPDAAHVALLGLRAAPPEEPPAPLYLRAPDAKLPGPLKPLPPQRRAAP